MMKVTNNYNAKTLYLKKNFIYIIKKVWIHLVCLPICPGTHTG